MIRPVPEGARLTQLWGGNPTYYQSKFGIPYHNGVDWAAPLGTPLRCIADGKIVYREMDQYGYGHYARVYHEDLQIFSFYAHMMDSGQWRAVGTYLNEGEVVGYMGSTGNSTGSHIHFEIRLAIDIQRYDVSPYAGIGRGRVNPLTIYAMLDRAGEEIESADTKSG